MWKAKGEKTNGWWRWEWLVSESGVILLVLDDVDSYMRTESGELDLSLRDC
jgi:hypothetical protein